MLTIFGGNILVRAQMQHFFLMVFKWNTGDFKEQVWCRNLSFEAQVY